MKSKNPFYNSKYFKGLSLQRRLKIRIKRNWHKVYCILDSWVIGKFKYGWEYNGQGILEEEL